MTTKGVKILECTLRDGSYAIDYQFTTEDTAIIAKGLENAGFEFIEIGHGLGLNASKAGEGFAAATDEEYLKIISSVLTTAKYGMFFIPGIGRDQDLKMAADYGMDFVRIGVNAPDAKKADNYIKIAKKMDMIVFTNLMKSYALPPDVLANNAKHLEKMGTDYVYLVDSAGGMLPDDVKRYIEAVKTRTETIEIGFHGHNNLSLALANTLVAIESGATIVDSCLQGIGRSAGNAQTEILVMVLERLGYTTGIDAVKTMDLGQKLIQPLIHSRGIDPIEITSGYAMFHSKNLKNILKYADLYGIDPRELIKESSKKNLIEVSEDLLQQIIYEREDKEKKITYKNSLIFTNIEVVEDFYHMDTDKRTKKIGAELFSLSKKTGKKSIFTISISSRGKDVVFPFIRENNLCVIGNCEISTINQLKKILGIIDGVVEIILVDADKKIGDKTLFSIIKQIVKKSSVKSYKDTNSWASAADALISQLIDDIKDLKIVIFGCNPPSIKLAHFLAERGANITIWDSDPEKLSDVVKGLNSLQNNFLINKEKDKDTASENANILIGFTLDIPVISKEMIMKIKPDGLIIDAGIGSVDQGAIRYAIASDIKIYRLDMRAGLSGEIITILETQQLIEKIAGKGTINGIPVVAGGMIGKRGDVVIDTISNPQRVIGVANGTGGIIKDKKMSLRYRDSIEKVKCGIIERQLR